MAVWTTPKTWNVGDVLTASDMNVYVRDNASYLYSAPACQVKSPDNAAITTGIETALTFAAEDYDPNSMHDNTTNKSRITPGIVGWWLVWANQQYALNGTGVRGLTFKKNGSTIGVRALSPGGDGSVAGGPTTMQIAQTTATSDYFEAFTYQGSGGNLSLGDALFGVKQIA